MLGGRGACGSVTQNEFHGRFFEVVPHNSGCRVLVFEREYFSQREWERQYAGVMNQVAQFLTRTHQTREEAAVGVAAMEQMLKLPGWSYESIGVDVDLQTPDVVYPDMEKDQAEAQRIFDEIVRLLKPYRANPAAGNAG